MATVKEKTDMTSLLLRSEGFQVVELWEHEFAEQKKTNPQLQKFLKSHSLQDRLNPRDAFFGGRTNALKLFYEGSAKYVDFTSLYPWVNKYCVYPIGHPEIITKDFKDVDSYFGLILCRVIPPRALYLPVLPYRCQGKLMFPLCRTCTENIQQTICTHSDEERALTGTWVSEEVKLAKRKGYIIAEIYEVYHFPSTSDCLFKHYIDLFLKIKQESSGWPREYENNICKNPGRRQVAKLALNSFWGRFGMNTNKGQLTFVNNVATFNKHINDPKKQIKNIYLPSEEVAAIQWQSSQNFVKQDTSTNIFIAAFTTAWARLKLYQEMDKLGENVLYHDTDSIIYASDGMNDPPLGNFLGEFTDELEGDEITTFVSGGPKNYGYKTKNGETCCKIRGFTLNYRNIQLLNFYSVRDLILSLDDTVITLCNPAKICRDPKKRKIVNKVEMKNYRIVYDKRVIKNKYNTLPYGY
ncbi:probable DNA polymerase [Caerostris extrusa]|uniref:DNA-directed DNA polymerase n=1 Tax=Caerostris extrusa TaxID=172846 RepID=A0AAV4V3K4_CAEEX|nr:probable DNA polymerase [Caerostris extrusa]